MIRFLADADLNEEIVAAYVENPRWTSSLRRMLRFEGYPNPRCSRWRPLSEVGSSMCGAAE
jgi:hypothetical protein